MKDSVIGAAFCEDFMLEEEEKAIDKQRMYNDILQEDGTLFKKIKNMKPIDAFRFLKECKCCDTHQINKPNILELWTDYQGGLEAHMKQLEKPCKCDCRALARRMCRGNINECKEE